MGRSKKATPELCNFAGKSQKVMRVTFVVVSLLMSIFSCSSENNNSSDTIILLNDGNRWEANNETTEGVNKMQDLLAEFSKNESKVLDDYDKLSIQLKKEFQLIFKNCTMTGPAHEQLHNFLVPILKDIKQLKTDDIQDCENTLQGLQNHLNTYPDFFN